MKEKRGKIWGERASKREEIGREKGVKEELGRRKGWAKEERHTEKEEGGIECEKLGKGAR